MFFQGVQVFVKMFFSPWIPKDSVGLTKVEEPNSIGPVFSFLWDVNNKTTVKNRCVSMVNWEA